MPNKKILLQGVTKDNHLTAVKQVLSIPNPDAVLISTAFVNEGGILLLEDSLVPVADKTTIFAGIRNGLTSAQGLSKSISIGCKTYAVDTGSRTVIFHPKIYFSRSANEARILIGSANLTIGGLNSNIEASIYMELNLADSDSSALIEQLEVKIEEMINEYPDHVFVISNNEFISQLLDSGRVVDESIVPAPTPGGSSRNRDLDTTPQMKLKTKSIRRPRVERMQPTAPSPPPTSIGAPIRDRLTLVWESNPLTRRYLTIPTSPTTHATGSMLFTQGAFEDIDQRHYFRESVFRNLDWHFDTTPQRRHMERAEGRFRLVIRDVDYGIFKLRLSHNSRTDSRAYQQHNSMTQLHWGEARHLIAREDLLGRKIYLFRDEVEPDLFVLEID